VHGAKGLEFPIVFLSGLEGFDHPRPASKVLWGAVGQPEVKIVGGFATPEYERTAEVDRQLEGEERRRLLYVAATRARDYLFVDTTRKERTTPSLLIRLSTVCAEFPDAWCRLPATAAPHRAPPAAAEERTTIPDDAASQATWVARRRASIVSGTRQPAWSATALSRLDDPGRVGVEASISSTRSEARGGQTTIDESVAPNGDEQRLIGRAVHDTLAKLAFDRWAAAGTDEAERSAEVSAIATAATEAQGLDGGRSPQVARLVGHALGAPTVRAIAKARHFRELPLEAPVELPGGRSGVIEGFADLVGQLEDGLVVVDFKTFVDRQTGSHAADPEHLRQVAAYAYALESATGLPVDRAVVCYLFDDGADEVSLSGEALAATVDDVLAAAGRAAAVSPSR
jgi:ATP-dependent helicase/nuclease subunit A